MIIFEEKDHKYTYKGSYLTSATSLLKEFKDDFDRDFQLTCSSYKKLLGDVKYRQMATSIYGRSWNLPKEWLELLKPFASEDSVLIEKERLSNDWFLSGTNGTAFHSEIEAASYDIGMVTNPFTEVDYEVKYVEKEYDNQSICDNLYTLEDGYYPELLVWDHSEASQFMDEGGNIIDQGAYDEAMSRTICGQVDCCWITTIDSERYVDTDDHKSNKNPPSDFRGNRKHPAKKYHPPFDHLWDNKVTDYNLQANLYQYLLTTFGFKRRYTAFTHYKDYDINRSKMYAVPDLTGEVKKMIEIYRDINVDK